MKKIFIILSMFLLLCGCGKSKDNVVKKFQNKIEKSSSYTLKGTMSIVSNEDTFTYNVSASKSKDDYYKVSLINSNNNHEQVILKNKDGVYVVTPDLNKSFKFQSDWPNNGSQSYLLDVLLKDVLNDDNVHIGKEDKRYIQCRVNYPNNNTLYSEKIYIDDNYDVKMVEVLDQDGNVKITLKVNSIDYKAKFDDNFFKLESLISEDENISDEDKNVKDSQDKTTTTTKKIDDKNKDKTTDNKEQNTEENNTNKENQDESTGNILKDIVYPLYIPDNTKLSSEDTISTDNGNRAILTFSGDSPFVLIEEVSHRFDELEIIPVNGEPLILSDSVGAISDNSLYWTSNGIDYYLSSNSIDSRELMTIAEGLTGTSVIVSSEK
mgnify:CR=1 FL=1